MEFEGDAVKNRANLLARGDPGQEIYAPPTKGLLRVVSNDGVQAVVFSFFPRAAMIARPMPSIAQVAGSGVAAVTSTVNVLVPMISIAAPFAPPRMVMVPL